MVRNPAGHESLNVVIPWSDKRFQFTSKHQACPVEGTMTLGGVRIDVGDAHPGWGVLDVGRGRWPYSTIWNWGGGAGLAADGSTVVGIQIGGKWTEGTGHRKRHHRERSSPQDFGRAGLGLIRGGVRSTPGRSSLPMGRSSSCCRRRTTSILAPSWECWTNTSEALGRWSGCFGPPGEDPIEFDGLVGFAEQFVVLASKPCGEGPNLTGLSDRFLTATAP